MDHHDELMQSYPPSLAAAKKIGTVPDGFTFYDFGWLGDKPEDFTVMKVRGAVFRVATRGPNKGRRSVKVPGTDRTVYVTREEIREQDLSGS